LRNPWRIQEGRLEIFRAAQSRKSRFSIAELVAGAVEGVENAAEPDLTEVRAKEFPEDDVHEYLQDE
jgi:hypothetical protein